MNGYEVEVRLFQDGKLAGEPVHEERANHDQSCRHCLSMGKHLTDICEHGQEIGYGREHNAL